MEFILNEQLIPMVNNGNLNITKIQCLVIIKEFIDRISDTKYLEDNVVDKITEMHNTMPSVITWGDYFQTELAYDLQGESDADFIKAVETVKYDIISSYEIFTKKNELFFEWVEYNYNEKEEKKDTFSREEYEEAVHLNILKDYYKSMKIKNNFSAAELSWYNNFKEAMAV
ncbi:MAG: hypothetical protein JXN64_08285 [Spirochaetes bacterium]|nr:hypothetical protein [Spirochaetota bacterium]